MGANTGKPYEKLAQVVFQWIVNQSDVRNVVVRHDVTLQGKSISHQIDVYWKFAIDIWSTKRLSRPKIGKTLSIKANC